MAISPAPGQADGAAGFTRGASARLMEVNWPAMVSAASTNLSPNHSLSDGRMLCASDGATDHFIPLENLTSLTSKRRKKLTAVSTTDLCKSVSLRFHISFHSTFAPALSLWVSSNASIFSLLTFTSTQTDGSRVPQNRFCVRLKDRARAQQLKRRSKEEEGKRKE